MLSDKFTISDTVHCVFPTGILNYTSLQKSKRSDGNLRYTDAIAEAGGLRDACFLRLFRSYLYLMLLILSRNR